MVLLLQVLQLPTREARHKLLQESSHALRDSDESAYSIVPSRRSISIHSFVSQISQETTDLTYQRLSFEEDLFAAPVYKRRYGNPLIHSVFRNNVQSASERREIGHPTSLVTRRSTTKPNDLKELSLESSLQSQAPSRNELATSKSYDTSRQKLKVLSLPEKRAIDFDSLPALLQRLPYRDDLKGKIGNQKDPGDGLVYSDREVAEAKATLHDFVDTWMESIAQDHSTKPETSVKARKIRNMAKICLILHGMKQERLWVAFWESGRTDINLPLSQVELISILKTDLEYASVFATEQYRIVRRDWTDGRHLALLEREPLSLIPEMAFISTPLSGLVERVRDSFTGAIYLRQEITYQNANAKERLLRQAAQPKKFRHRHVLQVMKTYQRGANHWILLPPNVSTDLEILLSLHKSLNDEDRAREYRIMLTVFGCLSRGLAHSHRMKATYSDIDLDHIVYNAASEAEGTAKFLWPDRRHAITRDSILKDEFHYPRFATEKAEAIFAFGDVMLSICNAMIGGEGGFKPYPSRYPFRAMFDPYSVELRKLHAWIDKKLNSLKEEHKDLEVILRLTRRMTQANEKERPLIEEVVEELTAAGSQYFCKECLKDLEGAKPKSNDAEIDESP